MRLTSVDFKNAKPANKKYKLSDGNGLYLEVVPSGHRYWFLKYSVAKKEKRFGLGVYPQVSLSEAREKCSDQRKLISKKKYQI
ncbi:Arm DNA-binding domain-containing protein [Pseudochryseolinea flava]|uniref:Integrase DNA-binding domain-containing protein n=1 Tax=Pseudochryseolinea flava TaxID=2059302 RepID=A0A364XZ81_9BACT|nr:Arm DNA-binding domain-containing protein [Pseudochryseolinea flava]RAV99656.1 hypothetical protein DQQ10_18855 [Pseudochryseolinea flava]